jgi:hypothetical protein
MIEATEDRQKRDDGIDKVTEDRTTGGGILRHSCHRIPRCCCSEAELQAEEDGCDNKNGPDRCSDCDCNDTSSKERIVITTVGNAVKKYGPPWQTQ